MLQLSWTSFFTLYNINNVFLLKKDGTFDIITNLGLSWISCHFKEYICYGKIYTNNKCIILDCEIQNIFTLRLLKKCAMYNLENNDHTIVVINKCKIKTKNRQKHIPYETQNYKYKNNTEKVKQKKIYINNDSKKGHNIFRSFSIVVEKQKMSSGNIFLRICRMEKHHMELILLKAFYVVRSKAKNLVIKLILIKIQQLCIMTFTVYYPNV